MRAGGRTGATVYALHAEGHGVADVEAQCADIDAIEQDIKKKGEEIARINIETGTPTNAAAGPKSGAGV